MYGIVKLNKLILLFCFLLIFSVLVFFYICIEGEFLFLFEINWLCIFFKKKKDLILIRLLYLENF